jgi:hypothetical protein
MKNFEEEAKLEGAVARRRLGVMTVKVDEIVGSVGKYLDFDREFRIPAGLSEQRIRFIVRALEAGEWIPPIDLYRIKDQYYVVDGNHRVAAARSAGQQFIDAEVTEFLPTVESPENALYRERSDFALCTGIDDIMLTEMGQYEKIINQICEHRHYLGEKQKRDVPFREAAGDWERTVYNPIRETIEEEDILREFPGRTVADLYVYICDHKYFMSQRRGFDIGFARAISDFRITSSEKPFKDKIRSLFINLVEVPLAKLRDYLKGT